MGKRLKILALQNTQKTKKTKFGKFIHELTEAISGTDQDYTSVRLAKAIFLLSIPMVLEMIMESVFAVVDIYFVSKLGPEAIATVGITESIMTIVYALGFGLSMGTTALISRRIGEKKPDKANNVAFQAILTGLVISLLIAIPGIIYASDLLALMGASEEITGELSGYTSIMLGTNMILMLLFVINAIFRSAGDAAISMRVLWLANILNIILDPLLIFGIGPFPELGIEGAAIATSIGRGTGVIYQLILLFKGHKRIKLTISMLKFDFKVIMHLIRLSTGAIMQNLIATASWIGLVRIVSAFGSEIMAGYTIAIRIIIFSLLPSWGLANAAATLVGQNLGAKKPKRAERAVWATGKANMIVLLLISLIFISVPDFFLGIFTENTAVISSGAIGLRIISIGMLGYGLGMVLVQAFNGAGDTITPMYINLACFWAIEIPLAYLLAITAGWEDQGVYYAIVIAESLLTLAAFILFKRGKWKLKKV